MSNLALKHLQTFEGVQQENADGTEYWSNRDLKPILEYNNWDKFKAVIHLEFHCQTIFPKWEKWSRWDQVPNGKSLGGNNG